MKIGKYKIEISRVRARKTEKIGDFEGLRLYSRDAKPLARVDVYGITSMITDRLRNVEYYSNVDYIYIRELFLFLKKNNEKIFAALVNEGKIVVDVKKLVLKDRQQSAGDMVFYDPFYKEKNVSRMVYIAPAVDMLDVVNNSDYNLVKNYGAMGILSPENSGEIDGYIDDEDRQKLQDDYQRKYGTTFGKWSILISQKAVRYQAITLPIEALQLPEKRKNALATLLQFYNIPKELHAQFESAKYANRNEAELDMYSNCVSKWASLYVEIARDCYALYTDLQGGYLPAEMWFDFVNVPALQERREQEKTTAREELRMWLELRSALPDRYDDITKRIGDIVERM